MPLLAGLAVAGLLLYVIVTQPKLRVAGSVLAAVLLAGATYYIQTTDDLFSQAERSFPVDDLRFDEVRFAQDARIATVAGRVENRSETGTVRQIGVRLRLYDCPTEDSALPDCAQIGEDAGVARLDLPPGQLRAFDATLRFSGLPAVTGVLKWDFDVDYVRATMG